MKILVIEPEKAPYEKEIGDDIHDMQAIVGGCLEPSQTPISIRKRCVPASRPNSSRVGF